MSQNLNSQSDASTIDSAVVSNDSSPQGSSANADDTSADTSNLATASGLDAREAQLDREYDANKNLLAPDDEEGEPETEKPEPKKEPEPEKEPPPEVVESEEATEKDPFEDEPAKLRTLEDINKQYPRAHLQVREDLAKTEAEKWALHEAVEKVGGQIGIEVAQTFMPALLNHSPSPAEAETFLGNVAEINPSLLTAGSRLLLDQSLTDERPDPETGTPINIATGNYLVKQYLSDKLDLETVEKLVAYEEAGIIDHDEMAERLEQYSGKTEREKQLEARLSAIEGEKVKESQAAKQSAEAQVQKRISHSDSFVSKEVMGALIPVAEHYGWSATKEELSSDKPEVKQAAEFKVALGEFITPWLENYRQSLPEYDALVSLAKDNLAFNADGKPTALYRRNLESLNAKVLATFKAKVRAMNPTLGKAFGTTRAAQLKQKITRSGTAKTQEIPEVRKSNDQPAKTEDRIAALDQQYDATIRETRASL